MTTNHTNTPASKTTKEIYALRHEPARYQDRGLAFAAAHRQKAGAVMLGDDGRYWVVCLADAARLEAAGLEWA